MDSIIYYHGIVKKSTFPEKETFAEDLKLEKKISYDMMDET